MIGKTQVKRSITLVGLSLLLIACSSLTGNQQQVEFIEIQFQDLEPSLAWAESDDQDAEEQGVSLYLEGIYALDGNTIFVYGRIIGGIFGRSVLLRSGDGARTWREVMTPIRGNSVLGVVFVEDGLGWVITGWTVEDMGLLSLYRSVDYGQTWEQLSTISNDRGTPYGMTFFNEQDGQIKIVYFTANPYSDRLAVLTTADGGLTWIETGSSPIWDAWDGVTAPEMVIDIGDRDEVREQFLDLAGWDHLEDGLACSEQCETIGQDGTRWQLHSGGFQEDHVIRRRLQAETGWTTITTIPCHYGYLRGRILPPER